MSTGDIIFLAAFAALIGVWWYLGNKLQREMRGLRDDIHANVDRYLAAVDEFCDFVQKGKGP